MDITARLLVGVGCVDSAACSTVILGGDGNEQKRKRRKLWRGKVEAWHLGRLHGAIRTPRRPPGRLVAWQSPGWLGGIPPSSLEARDGEEDPRAPGGPGGLAGPPSPWARGKSSAFFSIFSFLFLLTFVLFS